MPSQLHLSRSGRSRQFTTFNPETRQKTLRVNPGQSVTAVNHAGTGLITRIWFTFDGWFWRHWDKEAPVDAAILRTLILRIYWDNQEQPSVEVPMGDFFGIGHCEFRHYTSALLGMSSGGFYAYFPMPFERGVRIELENVHDSLHTDVFMNINYQELDELEPHAARFHCAFNSGYNPGTEPLTVLKAEGPGHFTGCCLSMQGRNLNYLSYLEAPEYIWIDTPSDEPPSLVGTGLEDYFNGGWYFRDGEFAGPYHGVPLKDTLRSMISMYRFHDTDAINFDKSIEVAFVNPWEPERLEEFYFSSTAYWYAPEARGVSPSLPTGAELLNMYRRRDFDRQSIP